MATPTALLVGTSIGLQIFGGILGAQAEKKQAGATAASLRYNAVVDELNAEEVKRAAEKEEAIFRREGRAGISAAEALAGGAGVTLETFAPALTESEKNVELDALAIRSRGRNQARNLKTKARLGRLEAKRVEAAAEDIPLTSILTTGAGITQTALLAT